MAMSLNEVISSLWSNIKTYLGNNYLSKNGKAASATVADKATADASGNVINTTYATKNELSGKQNKLTTTQLNAVNSDITSTKVTTYDNYATEISAKANASDLVLTNTNLGAHTSNSAIHVTSTERSNWNAKSNFSGSYTDLTNKPTIPTVNNATLTIQKNGTTVKTFSANASANTTANITVPTKTSDLTNDSDYATRTNVADSLQQAKNYTGSAVANCVNLTGTQTITGAKSIDNNINLIDPTWDYTNTTNAPHRRMYRISDKTGMLLGGLQLAQETNNIRYLALLIKDNNGVNSYVAISGDKTMNPSEDNTFSLGLPNRRWSNVYATTFYGNLSGNATSSTKATQDASGNVITTTYATKAENSLKANDSAVVHTSGNETISGTKNFTSNVINKITTYAVTDTPTSNLYRQYLFLDKDDTSLGFLQYASRTTGVRDLALYVNDKDRSIHGIQINSENYVNPIGNDSYCLGSTTSKWKSAYINSMISANITLSDPNFLRCTYGSYGTFWRQDGYNLYLMLTNKDDQNGNFNSYRPIQVALATGKAYVNGVDVTKLNSVATVSNTAGGTTSGTMTSTVGTMLFAYIVQPTRDYDNVTGSQVYAAVITTISGGTAFMKRNDTAINVGTWRVLGVSAGRLVDNYCMVIRVV